MRMISYAQNAEDVLLDRLFPEGGGCYIDVGAYDPVESSVTKHFYDRGWRGINIEPDPTAFSRMMAGRPMEINLNVGLSDREGVLTFHDAPNAPGWATFSTGQAANLRAQGHEIIERPIPVTTLARVCEEHVRGPIEFLKVDAESHETEVMAGADWSRWRPRAVVVEANGYVHWEPGLLASGYHFALFDGINRYYVRDEDRQLLARLSTMANFVDDFMPYTYWKAIQGLQEQLAGAEGRHRDRSPWVEKMRKIYRHPRFRSLIGGATRRVG